jgi:hypothetical protein
MTLGFFLRGTHGIAPCDCHYPSPYQASIMNRPFVYCQARAVEGTGTPTKPYAWILQKWLLDSFLGESTVCHYLQALFTPALERPFCLLFLAYTSTNLCSAQDCCLAFAKLLMLGTLRGLPRIDPNVDLHSDQTQCGCFLIGKHNPLRSLLREAVPFLLSLILPVPRQPIMV